MTEPGTTESATRATMLALGEASRAAAQVLRLAPAEQKSAALLAMAAAIRDRRESILSANAADIESARQAQRPAAFVDRLTLNGQRIESMAQGVETVARLPDPVGSVMARWTWSVVTSARASASAADSPDW